MDATPRNLMAPQDLKRVAGAQAQYRPGSSIPPRFGSPHSPHKCRLPPPLPRYSSVSACDWRTSISLRAWSFTDGNAAPPASSLEGRGLDPHLSSSSSPFPSRNLPSAFSLSFHSFYYIFSNCVVLCISWAGYIQQLLPIKLSFPRLVH